jgi:hypothetical protein
MPIPIKNEKKSHYIARCVKEVMSEGADQKAALGKCCGMFEEHKKKANASIIVGEEEILIFDTDENK